MPAKFVDHYRLASQRRNKMSRALLSRMFVAAILLAANFVSFRCCEAQDGKKKKLPEASWIDPIRMEPNGTKYGTFTSKTLGEDVSYLVYLPPQYDEKPTQRFPVIYWLHGLGGNQRGGAGSFLPRAVEAMQAGSLPPAIVVLVNGMVNSFYCDWANGKRPMESVIVKDLVPHIDQSYRTLAKREGRVIEGYSMGGFGAGHLGFKYPELFGTVVIDAGALIGDRALGGANISPFFEGAFGGDRERFNAEHPMQLVTKNADKIRGKQHIRIGCGGDDNLLPRNRELHELLTKLNIEHQYEVVEGIAHNAGAYYAKLGPKGFELHRQVFESLAKGE
jgi:enterochelin esterase-like enzyme